jgi:DNA-binding MarR family transcriptional regulator
MPPDLTSEQKSRLLRLRSALAPLQEQFSLAHLVSLMTIAAEPGLSVNELAERTGSPQASASRYVSVLLGRYQSEGLEPAVPLITQEISSDDPRRRALFLSDDGLDTVMSILNAAEPAIVTKGESA